MPIPFRAPALSSLLNATFLNKTIDDVKKGKLKLYKNDPLEVDKVEDVQAYLNQIADTTGQDLENDPDRKNYLSTNFISNGQNRKQAIEALDVQAQVSADDIINIYDILNDGTIKIKEYISDNAYETDNGVPAGGEIYYNSTTGFIRYYNAVSNSWDDVGKTSVAIQEVPTGVIDGVNAAFDVANMPINEEAINVFLNGLIIPKSRWSFLAPTITFDTPPYAGQDIYVTYLSDGNPSTPIISAGTNNVIYHVITAQNVTDKFFILPTVPSTPTHVLIDAVGGSTIRYGSDFVVTGDQVGWNALTLDGLVSIGDIFRVQYFN